MARWSWSPSGSEPWAGFQLVAMATSFNPLPEPWPVAVALPFGGVLVHLLMGSMNQPCHKHGKLLEAQLLVSIGVQVLHDVFDECLIPALLLQFGERRK